MKIRVEYFAPGQVWRFFGTLEGIKPDDSFMVSLEHQLSTQQKQAPEDVMHGLGAIAAVVQGQIDAGEAVERAEYERLKEKFG